ncbi:hypothetical protein SAY86_027651 [Trapa natans]|uniref:Pectinesterase n=1 Tax=Trapa natans TaxID=22666 RepID=A0AAN7QJK5_TRANT|nr:hypothetical protein SAY86_027651 [Trapa natans]
MAIPSFGSPKLFTALFLSSILLLGIHIDAVIGEGGSSSSSRPLPSVDLLQSQCLAVPAPQFLSSIQSTINVVRKVMGTVSHFGSVFGDFRLSIAISDCLDLLDFSTDELSWAASATQNPKNKHNGTGDLGSDLQTWLSATLANQDTCIEGFDGTSSILKGVVSSSLREITSLVRDLLSKVHPSSKPKSGSHGGDHGHGGRKLINAQKFPSWVRLDDRKLLQVGRVTADAVVAQDGTGNFTSVQDAVMAAPDYSTRRFVIYIKKGVYKENVEIKKKKWNIMMVGDGMGVTVISGSRSFVDGWTTFRSATFAVSGRGFIARDMTFENTAGPEKHQAVALRSDSDLSVFYRCSMKGYQDTLYTHTLRQFFRECRISGTIDFIFGDASAVFQSCLIQAKKGLPSQKNTITAQGRKDPNQPTGFSFQFCNVTADSDLKPYINTTMTYLGRPWKPYSRAVFMQSYLSEVLRPEGWLEWNGNFALNTLFYGEYMNYGPGAGLGRRVKWPGFHALNSSAQAVNYTVAQFIEGNKWLPSTGITYVAGFGV